MRRKFTPLALLACCIVVAGFALSVRIFAADESIEKPDAPASEPDAEFEKKKDAKPRVIPPGLTPLNKQGSVLIDPKNKKVILYTTVVLREGLLEMFCCLEKTKEHESILSVDARAREVHAGLLAVGAKPGKHVEFRPDFKPPTGERIDVFVSWKDAKGAEQRISAQKWVRYALHRFYVATMEKLPDGLTIPKEDEDLTLRYTPKFKELTWYGPMTVRQRDKLLALSKDAEYQKIIKSFYDQTRPREMDAHWLFAGSIFTKDAESGREVYEAEGGDLICVANFPTATLDVSIKSAERQDEGNLFEPYTERIPPVGTEVTVELIPVPEKKADKPGAKPEEKSPDEKSPSK